jgi:general secretion pathway protein A
MYNSYFGFREKPFKLVPNPDYLYLSKSHQIALAHLTYAVEQGDGFVVITGEVGTGKTTLCRNFLERLDERTESAYIFNPKLDSIQLLETICNEFGIRTNHNTVKQLLDVINGYLILKNNEDRKVILLDRRGAEFKH